MRITLTHQDVVDLVVVRSRHRHCILWKSIRSRGVSDLVTGCGRGGESWEDKNFVHIHQSREAAGVCRP